MWVHGTVTITNSQALAKDELDAALLKRVEEGDRESFAALHRRFYTPLTRFAYRYLRSAETIEEVVNDTMFAVWQNAANFRGGSRVSTWIMGIMARKCWQVNNKNHLETSPIDDSLELSDPKKPLDDLDTERTLSWGIHQLSENHQACVELAYGYGYTCEEIGEIMACPASTVKTRLHYARKTLKELFNSDIDERVTGGSRS